MMQNELQRLTSLLPRSTLSCFWLSSGSTPELPNCRAVMNCLLCLQYGLHDDLATILPCAVLQIHQLPEHTQVLFSLCWIHQSHNSFFHNFTRHSRSDWCFQLITRVLDGFFEFLVLRVSEIDLSQFSCVFKMEFNIRPFSLLLQLGILSLFLPDFWP